MEGAGSKESLEIYVQSLQQDGFIIVLVLLAL